MMVTELLTELAEVGVQLSVEDGRLKVRSPKGALTPDLKGRLGEHKDEILRLLGEEAAHSERTEFPTIVPDVEHLHEPFPLTEIQQAYWIGSQSDLDYGGVDIHFYTEVECRNLDLDGLTRAWRRVVDRHPMLRAVVVGTGEQQILPEVPEYTPKVEDLRDIDADRAAARLAEIRDELSISRRDPEVWPPFEVRVTWLDGQDARLHVSIDLLHVDGGSLQLIFRDLVAFYDAPEHDLPPLTLSYRDYVLAEQGLHDTDFYARSLDFWRGRLPSLPPAPDLPVVRDDGQARFAHGTLALEREVWDRVKGHAKRYGFSPPAVLLTVYSEVLALWSRGTELTVNVTLFNRLPMHPEVHDLVGDFTSMVLLGISPEADDSFATRVRRNQETLWSALEHRHVSGVQVLRELARQRGNRASALMPVVFTSFLNLDDSGDSSPSHTLRRLGEIGFSITQTPQVWLDHQVMEDDGQLLLSWDALESVFPEGLTADLFDAYRRLIHRLADADVWEGPVRGLLADADVEQRQALNATERPMPELTLYDLFARQAAERPDHPALVAGDYRFTYGELFERANRLGRWLVDRGVGKDRLVAVMLEKGWHQVPAVLGTFAAGAAYMPIDPDLPVDRIRHLLEDGEVTVLLTQRRLDERLRHSDQGLPDGLTVLTLDGERETEAFDGGPLELDRDPRDLAYVLYTSGSTGLPKGVMIEHRSVVNRMVDICERFHIGPDDRILGVTALHHDLSVFDVCGVLTHGATLVLPAANRRLDPAHWAELMVEEGVTLWNSVPTFLDLLVRHLETSGDPAPATLRWTILAGDWIPLDLPERLRAQVGEVDFIASGGPTETTIWDIWNRIDAVDPEWTSIPYGKPLANARYHILNDDLEPCPTWVPGEMCIGGAGLARGYWKNPEASKAFFIHPVTGERLYRSGDLGRYLPDGNIEILGRKDHQVKIRGMRIELGEIESTLTARDDIAQAVAVATGGRFGDKALVAFVVPEDGAPAPDHGALADHLGEALPSYMVPSRFVTLDALPLGATGKLDRKALKAQAEDSTTQSSTGPAEFVEPRTPLEAQVATAWCEALGVEAIGVETDLLDLSVSSLTAIQVSGKLQEALGVELPLRLMLETPTIAAQARAAEELLAEGTSAALPKATPDLARRHEPFDLNPIQQAYWMGRMGTFELGNVAALYYLEFEIPNLDVAVVENAWRAVVERHDMLRVIVRSDGRQQILEPVEPYVIEFDDMADWDRDEALAARDALRERMAHQVRPTDQWPLFEMRATRVEPDRLRLHFYLDLLIADAWSAQILFDDFRRKMIDPDLQLEPFALSFRDYLEADAELEGSDRVASSREYWWGRLDTLPPAPDLPLARDPATLDAPRFERRAFQLEPSVWGRLKARANDLGATPSGLLLAAFGEVLARWSTDPRLTINVTTFRRLPLHPEANAIVGDFTSLTLLEVDASRPDAFEDRVVAVQDQLWQDLDHRYLSGIEVVRELAKRRDRQPGALMPVVFTSLLTRYSEETEDLKASPDAGYDEVYALSQTPQVWLDHQVLEQNGALAVSWDAVEGLFPDGLVDAMIDAFEGLLRGLAADDGAWRAPALRQLPAAQAEQRVAVNATTLELGALELRDATLHGLFRRQAEAQPDRTAVLAVDRELTYGEVADLSRRVAHWLREQSVPDGGLVAIVMEKGWQQMVAALGILEAGAAYLPVDPAWPVDRRRYVLEHGDVRAILTQASLDASLDWPSLGDPPKALPRLAVDGERMGSLANGPVDDVADDPDRLAYVIFTSGSTGRPKGVSITHRGAVNTILDINRRFDVGRRDRALAVSSLAFDLSVYDLFGMAAAGGAVVMPAPGTERDPAHWLERMHRHGVSVWNSVPALMELLCEFADLRAAEADDPSTVWPSALRLALLSGDWLPVNIAERIWHHGNHHAAASEERCRVVSLGGATEASIWSIFHEITAVDPDWRSVPYGQPLANQAFHVLDRRSLPAPVWVPGELHIAGVGLARDYFGDPELTAGSFVTHGGPAVDGAPQPGERLYRTGDWGRYLPDGSIEFLGRRDSQVKIQGHRIELGEIESVLAAFPGVASAVVLALGEARDLRSLAAFYVPSGTDPSHAVDPDALRAHAEERLAPYMVPRSLVALERLPLTANGKVDRKALAALAVTTDAPEERVAPRTAVEEELAALWRELLEVDTVGVHDTLFDLGGNSLVAIRMLSRLHEAFQVEVSMTALFESPTVAGLADVIVGLKAQAGETGQGLGGELQLAVTADPGAAHAPFPLSDVQQAYLLGRMAELELGNVAAHAYLEIEIPSGAAERLATAWQALVARHTMLRTVFGNDGTQRVLDEVPQYDMPIYELEGLDDLEVSAHLETVRDELSHQVLPADTWPLFDVRISRFSDAHLRLHISFDLLIADAWSSQILFWELASLAKDPEAELPQLDITFRDYMVAVDTLPQTAAYARAERFWKARLDTLPPAPDLPLARDPASIEQPIFERRADRLEPEVWNTLQGLASARGMTPSGLCLAAFAEVLAAWSAGPRFTVNVTTFNRLPIHPQVQDLIGDFTSVTLLAVDSTAGGPFQDRARRVQEQLWQDLDHRHYSGVQVVRELAARQGRAPGALMPVVFTSRLFTSSNAGDPTTEEAWGEVSYSVSQTPQVWLDMQVSEEGGALTWTWDAVADLFPEGCLDAMFEAYGRLLRSLADEAMWQRSVGALTAPDFSRQLEAYNATNMDFGAPSNLYQLVARSFVAHRDQTAVITPSEALSYGELESMALAIAGWVRHQGVDADGRVAILMDKGWEQIPAALGVAASGGAYVPLDPEWPVARLRVILADAGVRAVLTTADLRERLADLDAVWGEGALPRLEVSRDGLAALEPGEPVDAQPSDLAYVIFTSGTTGRPKGVAVEHGAAVNTLVDLCRRHGVGPGDRVFGLSSLTFDLSVFDVFGTLSAGATLVLPASEGRRDPARWSPMLRLHKVTVWNSVPALLDLLLAHAEQQPDAVPDGLRLVLLSGDWLPLDIAERLHRHAPDAAVFSLGGATEAAIWSIDYPLAEGLDGWSSVPYGRPLANQGFHVLDAALRPCPPWVPGDLHISGVGLAREYLGDPEKTAASFFEHPDTGLRLYRTGDRGRLRPSPGSTVDDGHWVIEFLGRQDTQVKVQGYRIELGDVETALAADAGVAQVVAAAVGPATGSRRLVAYVVPHDLDVVAGEASEAFVEGLRTTASDGLPSYMVPSAFVVLERLPLTANGKVDRKALPDPAAALGPADGRAPRTPVEAQLAAIWGELLDLDDVGIHDNLFELGGSSLLAIRMVGEIRDRLGVELGLQKLFEHQTVAELAEAVAQARSMAGDLPSAPEELQLHLDPASRYEPFPLSDVQQAYWLGREQTLELGNVAAHSYTELDTDRLDPERIQWIWRRLIERHDMLRAIVLPDGRQRVIPQDALDPFTIPVDDLSSLDAAERDARLQATRDAMSHQVLLTDRWPLFDIRISRLDAETIRVHYSFDLLIADAWSSQLLTLEFAYLYADPEAPLQPLELTFRDYLLATSRRDLSSRYRRDRSYWRQRLDALPAAPELPLAKDPATLGPPRFVRRHGALDADAWGRLKGLASGLGITPSALLMAVFAEALAGWSRRPEFTLNVTTFNRMPLHEQVETVVGDFTSLTLLAVDTGGAVPFELRARRVQEQLWSDLDHRTYSGVEVIRDLARAQGKAPGALMPVVFTSRLFDDPRIAEAEQGEPYGDVVYSVSQTPQVWLDSQVLEDAGRLVWSWDTVDELFPDGLIDGLFAAQTRLLEHLATGAEAWKQHTFDLLPEAHAQLQGEANATDLDFGDAAERTLDQLVEEQAAAHPDRVAVIAPDRTLTYGELWRAACALAHDLRQQGLGPDQHVAVVMVKGWEQAVATVAVMLAGGAYLPVHAQWPGQRRQTVFDTADVRLALAQPGVDLSDHDDLWVRVVDDALIDGALGEGVERPEPVRPEPVAGPSDLAYTIFTSGSTGIPKGTAIEHRSALNTLLDINRRFEVTADDRVLALSDLSFDLSVFDLFGMFAAGGALVLPPQDALRDPSAWAALCRDHGVTLWNSVPALMDMMLTYAEGQSDALPSTLRLAMLSGDWLPVDIGDRLVALLPEARTVSLGGATEASIWSIAYPLETPAPAWPSVPYGKPLANQTFHVLDAQLRPRPVHVPGDLFIGGVGLAREYLGDAEKTAASFFVHPRSGERLYRTGDMGKYLPSGDIEFLGREDTQVKVQGFRIELGEIEAALAQSPALAASVAAAPWTGSGGARARRLVAYLVVRPEHQPLDLAALKDFLGERLPEYMVPTTVVELDSLPLTANGKVDRRALPDIDGLVEEDSRAPRTSTEQRLARIWSQLLGVENLGIDDNLFDLGGTSVVAVQMLSAIREEFGMELTLRTLFENLTIRNLALAMSRDRASGQAVMVSDLPPLRPDPAHRHEPFPLNDIQQAYWVSRMGVFEMGNFSAHYYTEVDSLDLDLDGFIGSFRHMIERHDALRLVFLADGRQQILETVPPYEVQVRDFRDLDAAETETRLLALRDTMSHRMMPPDQWPLFEVCATHIDERRTRLHLSFDLLLADAWSFQLVFQEMADLARSPDASLEPLEISFRDYVLAEKQLEETELFQRSRAYWLERLETLPAAPDLPLLPDSAARSEQARFRRFDASLPAEDWTRMQEAAAALGVTPTGVLMTAFSEALGAWSRHPAFTLNVTMFNRLPMHPQVQSLVGDFTSMTLVGVDTGPMGDEDSFALRARRLQERLWTDLDHSYYGGVKVLRDYGRRHDMTGAAMMPVVFTSRLFKIQGFDGDNPDEGMGEVVYSISQTPQVWIDHQLTEEDGVLQWNWDAVADLFPEGMIDAMFEAYSGYIHALAADPELWHRPVPALVPADQRVALRRLATTEAPAPPPVDRIHRRIAEHASDRPAATALLVDTASGEIPITYGTLQARATAIQRWLELEAWAGAPQHDRPVALVLRPGWEQAVAALGAMAAGAPFMALDPRLDGAELAAALEWSGASAVLTHSKLLPELHVPDGIESLAVDAVTPRTDDGGPDGGGTDDGGDGPGGLAYVHFAQGESRRPRGVSVSHRAAIHALTAVVERGDLSRDDRTLLLTDLTHDRGIHDLFATLWAGGTAVIPRPGRQREATYLASLARRQGVTLWSSDPELMDAFAAALPETTASGGPDAWRPRLVLLSGDTAPTALVQRLHAAWPGARILCLAGAPETATWSLAQEVAPDADPESTADFVALGRPLGGVACYVLDKQLRPRPLGVPGDLYLAGEGLAEGYWNDDDSTHAVFIEVPDPLAEGDDAAILRLFRTGDVCRLDADGRLELIARDESPITLRRRAKELGEIETVLQDFPAVGAAAAAMFPVRNPEPGALTRRLVAYVVPKGAQASAPGGQAPPAVDPGAGGMPMTLPVDRMAQLEVEPIFTPLERLQFKLERRGLRPGVADGLELEAPALEGETLERLIHRRSRRRFDDRPVPLADLSELLEALRQIQPTGVPLPKYRYPSGGGLYPVQTYVSIEPDRVEGLAAGIYYYHPRTHRLEHLDDRPAEAHFHAPENRPIAEPSAFTLFFIGRLSAVAPLYPDLGRDFCVLESGYMGQLLMETTPPAVGLCPLGGMAFDPIRERFHLENTDELVHVIVGGAVATADLSLQDAFMQEQLDARDMDAMTEKKAVVVAGPPADTGNQDTTGDGDRWARPAVEQPDWASQAIYDPIQRLQFKLDKKGLRPESAEAAELPASPVDAALDARWARRRSYQQFLSQSVSLAQLGHWLSCLRSVQPSGMPLPKYRYPSGGGLYPVQTYLHVKAGAVDGLGAGTYYYDPLGHRLEALAPGVDIPAVHHGPPNRPIYETAGFSLFLVGRLGAVAPLYPGLARDFCLLEAGYMGQLLMETAVDHGVGVTPLGGLAFEDLRPHFHLEDDHDLVHTFVGGAVPPPAPSLAAAFAEGEGDAGAETVDVGELREYLVEHLPPHQVPTNVVVLDHLPQTLEGRLDRAALPDPSTMGAVRPESFESPADEGEERIAGIWKEILGLEELSVTHNFFEMGGTSVQMVQLHGRLQEQFERSFPLVTLFEQPSIRDQARFFQQETATVDMDEAKEQAARRKAARRRRRRR